MRHGLSPWSRQICATVSLPICRCSAKVRVVQWGAPVRRCHLACHPQHLRHRPHRQPRLTPAALGDPSDTGHALAGESMSPVADGIRSDLAPPPDLVIRDTVGGPDQRLGLNHGSMCKRGRRGHALQGSPLCSRHRERRCMTAAHRNHDKTPTQFTDIPLEREARRYRAS